MRFALVMLVCALLVGAVSSNVVLSQDQIETDAIAMVTAAADKIRAVDTFSLTVAQLGPDYFMYTTYAPVIFRSARGQYVAPNEIQASVRVLAGRIPITVDVYSRGEDQWYRAIWTGSNWVNQPFQEGFNPETLIAEDTGIKAALDSLIDIRYSGETTLESGVSVDRLDATAEGADVTALLGGLIEPVGVVEVEVYIDRAEGYPVRFVIREFDSPFAATPFPGDTAEPVEWTIDLYDFNAPPQLDRPPVDIEATPEVTPEATEAS